MRLSPLERFDRLHVPCPETGCWLWLGCTDGKGYGMFTIMGKPIPAHRFSWEITHKLSARGKWILHKCDVPTCVNPGHLFLGDAAANAQDMKAKGRHCYGERSAKAKLTAEQVIAIRKRRAAGEKTTDLGREFGVAGGYVSVLCSGASWKHLL